MKINVDERQALCYPLSLLGELAIDLQTGWSCQFESDARVTGGGLGQGIGGGKTSE